MAKTNQILSKLRKICLSLPGATETMTWGKPHFRVADKIFAGFGEEDGKSTIGFKLRKEHAAEVMKRPGFSPAPYVGKHGWVSMQANDISDWDEVRGFVLESYRLIVPKKSLDILDSNVKPTRELKKKRPKKSMARKAPKRRSS